MSSYVNRRKVDRSHRDPGQLGLVQAVGAQGGERDAEHAVDSEEKFGIFWGGNISISNLFPRLVRRSLGPDNLPLPLTSFLIHYVPPNVKVTPTLSFVCIALP